MKRALVTGALGQDGSYLSEHLLRLGYEVYGTVRMPPRISEHYVSGVHYVYADLKDATSLLKAIRQVQPHEIYNLGGQVFVPNSFIQPCETFDANVNGLARIISILESLGLKHTKVYQASTSEMFGNILAGPGVIKLDETVEMNPVSPYGVSKLAAHKLCDVYRQRGMYIVSGILFNHESPRRGIEMVTRKISRHVARWAAGDMEVLRLGSVDSRRDWGYAGDFVEAMHLMLQQPRPEDYVIGTGEAHSIDEFLTEAMKCAGLEGKVENKYLQINCSDLARLPELHTLVADCTRAKTELGWKPKHSFKDLVKMMVEHDMKLVGMEASCSAN